MRNAKQVTHERTMFEFSEERKRETADEILGV